MNDEIREVIDEFLVESSEGLDRLDTDLVELEEDPKSPSALGSIFRTMHTIKGTCGFLGFSRLEKVTHAAENLLSLLRAGSVSVDREIIDALLASVDAVRSMLAVVEATGDEPSEDHPDLRAWLTRLQDPNRATLATPPAPAPAPPAQPVAAADVPTAAAEPAPPAAPAPVATAPKAAKPAKAAAVAPAAAPVEAAADVADVADDIAEPVDMPVDPQLDDEPAAELAEASVESEPDAVAVVDQMDKPIEDPKKKKKRSRRKIGEILKEKGFVQEEGLMLGITEQSFGDTRPLGQILQSLGIVTADHLMAALREQQVLDDDRQATGESTVRVDVHLLDTLMNLIGELVLARNQLMQLANDRHDTEFLVPAQRLNLITSELQEGVMKTRMQPIGSVWQRLPRVVRDLAVGCNKKVRIEVDGAETELDRTILEAIKDPLTHLVRNAVDHGIETPDERVAHGKDPEGTLMLRAFHESGKVNIEITDDGGGIDPAKIRAKALEVGLLTAEQAARTTDREVLSYIFAPGFSTAAEVTNISGRGVGMDVVKTNIEKIGGAVELQSEVGRGTTIRVKIPLTLAIIPALVVLSSGQRYVIPQINLVELVRLDNVELGKRIELIHGAPVYRLRGRLLPIVDLADVLRGGSGVDLNRVIDGSDGRSVNIVVLQADGHAFGLVVDGVFDTQEIVVKPLGQQLRDIRVFAGATIMGDGKLSLILDVIGLARQAGVVAEQIDRPITARGTGSATNGVGERSTLVIVRVGDEQAAVPLADIARLEQIPVASAERSKGQTVVQYRGEILPLLGLADALGVYGNTEHGDNLPVLVHTVGDRMVGLVVQQIVDITDALVDRRESSGFITGTAVVANKVTDVIDTTALIRSLLGIDSEQFDNNDNYEMTVV